MQLGLVADKLKNQFESYRSYFSEIAMFWDWLSLYQKDVNNYRTLDEQAAFRRAVNNMGMWYAHQKVMCFYLTRKVQPDIAYDQRGWTFFERSCAEMIKGSHAKGNYGVQRWSMCVNIGEAHGEAGGREPPVGPVQFAEKLCEKNFTTKADKASVVKLYTKTSLAMLRGLKHMTLSGLPA